MPDDNQEDAEVIERGDGGDVEICRMDWAHQQMGQRIIRDSLLPMDMRPKLIRGTQLFELLAGRVLKSEDHLFYKVVYPPGWKIMTTGNVSRLEIFKEYGKGERVAEIHLEGDHAYFVFLV